MAALFEASLATDQPCVNLFRPRIHEPRVRRFGNRTSVAIAASILVLLIGLAGWLDLHHLQRAADRSQAELDELQPEVRAAKPVVQRLQYVADFAATQPRYLACLRDLTEGVAAMTSVQLSHFDLNDAMQGSCDGEASAQQEALDFVDKLSASKRFAKVNCKLDGHPNGNDGEKVTFRIAFGYLPGN